MTELAIRNNLGTEVTFAGQTHLLGAEQFGDVAGLLVGSVVNTVLGGTITGVTNRAGQVSNIVSRKIDYSHIPDPRNVNASTRPTPRQVREMKDANRAQNGGVLRDDVTGEEMVDAVKSRRGVTPPTNEVQVDHIISVDKGGTREMINLELRTRANNRQKSNK